MAINYMKDFDISVLENYHEEGAVLPLPDQYVGELKVKNGELIFNQAPRDSLEYLSDEFVFSSKKNYHEKNIFVLLESPHRFEYNASNKPIAMVMGKTGCNLFDLFTQALSKSKMRIKAGLYNVILANVVQYQTSCGLNPIDRKIRDLNWLDIYNNYGGEIDLKKRIFSVKPRYTINCCTGGKNPNGLRQVVNHSLINFGLKKGKHFTEGNHPASWNFHGDTSRAVID